MTLDDHELIVKLFHIGINKNYKISFIIDDEDIQKYKNNAINDEPKKININSRKLYIVK